MFVAMIPAAIIATKTTTASQRVNPLANAATGTVGCTGGYIHKGVYSIGTN